MYWLNPNGGEESYISKMVGFDPCQESYHFENANDLHTSVNVNGMLGGGGLISGSRSYDGMYTASGQISTGVNVQILDKTSVEFQANRVILNQGLVVENGAKFTAWYNPCRIQCADIEKKKSEQNFKQTENDVKGQVLQGSSNQIVISKIRIYPNPTDGEFAIQNNFNSSFNFKIVNALGAEISTGVVQSNSYVTVNSSKFDKGLYFILFSNAANKTVYKKLVVH